MFDYVPKNCLLVNVRTFEVQPEETENISSAHEAMRAINGFALAVPNGQGYRIFPPDIWRNMYYTHINLEVEPGVLVIGVGNHPTNPTKMFAIDFEKEIKAFWQRGLVHLLQVCSVIRMYHLMMVAEHILEEVEKLGHEVARN
ncbi:MAG: hypothetical protein QG665_328 [Patescibacteria group bacterium]|nr:hypothetical protein [Patescibacteria group bacterium]